MIRFGQYLPGKSPLHALDPRTKTAAVLVLSAAVLSGGPTSCALVSALLLGVAVLGRIPARELISALKPGLFFLALLFALHLLFTEGTPIPPFSGGWVTPTFEGLHTGALVTWRFALLLGEGALLTMTTSPGRLVSGLEWFLRPLNALGLRSHELALMVSLALRFVPTLLEEVHKVKDAQIARGAVFGRGAPLRRIRAVSRLVLPVVLGAFRRADDLAMAMEARGYSGAPRSHLEELRITGKDMAAGVVVVGIAVVVMAG